MNVTHPFAPLTPETCSDIVQRMINYYKRISLAVSAFFASTSNASWALGTPNCWSFRRPFAVFSCCCEEKWTSHALVMTKSQSTPSPSIYNFIARRFAASNSANSAPASSPNSVAMSDACLYGSGFICPPKSQNPESMIQFGQGVNGKGRSCTIPAGCS